MEITFGWEPRLDLLSNDGEARDLLHELKRLGATSIETYVHWNLIEPEPGRFDWDRYDRDLALVLEQGLRWVPFIILGPWYVTPDWFQDSPESLFARCLEHEREGRVQSIWNPALGGHVARVLDAFGAHYANSDSLESVLLGITGDYGEAIYQAVGNWPRGYHTHRGYWCGDERAITDFQHWLRQKFGSVTGLNRRWGSRYRGWEDIHPSLRHQAASDRAWLDQITWYRESMVRWADHWLVAAHGAFPRQRIYLCTGGDGMPHHGSDFSLQCRIASERDSGVRITNEGSDYSFNFLVTRLVSTASRHYGNFFGIEPASAVDPPGIVARIYNVATSGAAQLHEYSYNVYTPDGTRDDARRAFELHRAHLQVGRPTPEVAVLLPTSDLTCREVGFSRRIVDGARWLRDVCDFDLVDENLVRDGAMVAYRFLVVLDGSMLEAATLQAVERWVLEGGALLSWQLLRDVEGSDAVSRRIFGLTPRSQELVGIQSLRLLEPAFLSHLAQVPRLVTVRSYDGLNETVLRAAETELDGTDVIWLNRCGNGWGVFYTGPIEDDPDLSFTWMGDQHMYLHVIRDFLFRLSEIAPGWQDLAAIDDELDGVYGSELEDRWLYFNSTSAAVQKSTPIGSTLLAPHSIGAINKNAGSDL